MTDYDLSELNRLFKSDPIGVTAALSATGAPVATCDRCGVPCRVRGSTNEDARLLKYADKPEGICVTCGAAMFLKSVEYIKMMLDTQPEKLLHSPLQEQFASLMAVGNADARPSEIDWRRMSEQRHLQDAPKRRKKK
jgi:hypothetical protein